MGPTIDSGISCHRCVEPGDALTLPRGWVGHSKHLNVAEAKISVL